MKAWLLLPFHHHSKTIADWFRCNRICLFSFSNQSQKMCLQNYIQGLTFLICITIYYAHPHKEKRRKKKEKIQKFWIKSKMAAGNVPPNHLSNKIHNNSYNHLSLMMWGWPTFVTFSCFFERGNFSDDVGIKVILRYLQGMCLLAASVLHRKRQECWELS